MNLSDIKDPSIAAEKYKLSTDIRVKIPKEKWIKFIDNHRPEYFDWLENTEQGKKRLNSLDRVPEKFKPALINSLNKAQACAEYNSEKGYYEVIVEFVEQYGKIVTTYMRPIEKKDLQILLEMAKSLNAILLNHGQEIIDENFVNSL